MPRKHRNHATGSRYGPSGPSPSVGHRVREPALDLVDRQQVVVDHRPFRGVLPLDRPDPLPMGLRPVLASRKVQTAPQQQLAQPMASALHIVARIIPGPTQDRATASSAGVGGWTSVNRPARSNSASLRASRLSVFTRSPGLRGISAGAMTTQVTRPRMKLPLERVAARPRLVTHPHGTRRFSLKLSVEAIDRLRLVGHRPRHRHSRRPDQHRHV